MLQSRKNIIRPSQLVLIGDQLLVMLGLLSAVLANYRILAINEFPIHTIVYRLFFHIAFGVFAWVIFGIYKKVIRFFSSKDFLILTFIIFLIHVFSIAIGIFFSQKNQLKPEIFVISFFITTCYIIGTRLIISYLYFHYRRTKSVNQPKRLLIYGAGEMGVFLKKSINSLYQNEFSIIGFLDDDKKKIGRFIGGLRVFDASTELGTIIDKYSVTDVVIANNSILPARKAKFLEDILPYNLKLKELSSVQSLLDNGFKFERLASIEIGDLMNRKQIELYDEHVADCLKNKTILVTGAAGSIGSEIVRKLSEHDATLIICVDFSESALYDLEQELKRKHSLVQYKFILTDIRNEELMDRIFEQFRPNFVYHAAAYKHVPLMEEFPWEAVQTNVFGTQSIVKKSISYKVEKFVFISSDKAVNPTSVMGATKRLAEIIVQAAEGGNNNTSFVVTRFGNVLGSNGSVVPLFKKQIQAGGPVTVTHPEMIRYFMTIAEACQLVLEASVMANGGEVFVFDMGEPVKIVDLAKNMIRLAGFIPDQDIKIQFIGQRPGEKLYEEVFAKDEKMKETHHEKIMISAENKVIQSDADLIIKKLKSLEGFYEPELFRDLISQLLPEFNSVKGNPQYKNHLAGNNINQYKFQN